MAKQRKKKQEGVGIWVAIVVLFALGAWPIALILLFVNQLIGLYSGLSPETVALARSLVVLHCSFAILMWPVAFVLPSALRAANDVKFTMWVGVGSMLVFRVFGSWLLCVQMEMGAMGVWIAMILDWVCRIAFYLPRMISGKWKSKYRPT